MVRNGSLGLGAAAGGGGAVAGGGPRKPLSAAAAPGAEGGACALSPRYASIAWRSAWFGMSFLLWS